MERLTPTDSKVFKTNLIRPLISAAFIASTFSVRPITAEASNGTVSYVTETITNPCNGSELTLSGTVETKTEVTANSLNTETKFSLQGFDQIGEEYRLFSNDVSHISLTESSSKIIYQATIDGKGNIVKFKQQIIETINPDDSIKVSMGRVSCK